MLILEHLRNWVDYGHSLFFFLILTLFWHRKMGKIWGFWSCSVDFPHCGAPLIETGHILGSWALSGGGGGGHISDALRGGVICPTLCVEFCLVLVVIYKMTMCRVVCLLLDKLNLKSIPFWSYITAQPGPFRPVISMTSLAEYTLFTLGYIMLKSIRKMYVVRYIKYSFPVIVKIQYGRQLWPKGMNFRIQKC